MKNLLLSLVIGLLVFPFASATRAQESDTAVGIQAPLIYPQPPITSGMLGQDHRYSVAFRGNGEAVVIARLAFTNQGETPLSTVSLRIPKGAPTDLITFQILRDPQCIRYKTLTTQEYELLPNGNRRVFPPVCDEYQEPDFSYWGGGTKYQKATADLHADTVDITLPKPIAVNKSGAFILFYRAFGYATKDFFGGYDFSFESMKVEESIQNLTVGITVDDDLVLADTKGSVNFRFEDAAMGATKEMSASAPASNGQLDQIINQVGYGQIVKTASNLAPLDSYMVKGRYADSVWKLQAQTLGIAGLIALVVLCILIFMGKKIVTMVFVSPKREKESSVNVDILLVAGSSFTSALLIIIYTALLFLARGVFNSFYYQYAFLLSLLVVIISLGIYSLLLVAPAILVGVKRGVLWGLATFGATVVWLIVDAIIVVVVIVILGGGQGNIRPYPVPMIDKIMGGPAKDSGVGQSSPGSMGSTEPAPQAIPDSFDPTDPSM